MSKGWLIRGSQVNYIVKMIAPMVKYGVTSFECKLDAEMRYNREIQARLSAFDPPHSLTPSLPRSLALADQLFLRREHCLERWMQELLQARRQGHRHLSRNYDRVLVEVRPPSPSSECLRQLTATPLRTRNPVWESYLQLGGTRRMAVRHRGGQLIKALATIALAVLFQRLGYKKIKNETTLFLIVRSFFLDGRTEKLIVSQRRCATRIS